MAANVTPKRGELHGGSVLTDAVVQQMRALQAYKKRQIDRLNEELSIEALCKLFGCHFNTATKALTYETWKHVPDVTLEDLIARGIKLPDLKTVPGHRR